MERWWNRCVCLVSSRLSNTHALLHHHTTGDGAADGVHRQGRHHLHAQRPHLHPVRIIELISCLRRHPLTSPVPGPHSSPRHPPHPTNTPHHTTTSASANPVDSRYNPRLSVVENIRLPPTLLSRFDLIYLVRCLRCVALRWLFSQKICAHTRVGQINRPLLLFHGGVSIPIPHTLPSSTLNQSPTLPSLFHPHRRRPKKKQILDTPDEDKDRRLAKHLVSLYYPTPAVEAPQVCEINASLCTLI